MSDKHLTKFIQYLHNSSAKQSLPAEAKDHALKGEWQDFREFHISGDVLVIYQIENNTIKFVGDASSSDL